MNRFIPQKFDYVPSNTLFHYKGKLYLKYQDNAIPVIEEGSPLNEVRWVDKNILVWVDTFIILMSLIGEEIRLVKVNSDGFDGPDEPFGILTAKENVFRWNHIIFLSSQVVYINQATKVVYIEI